MTNTDIETVLQVLEKAGFERLPKPLVVAGSTFDFDAAVRGTGVSHDLVVVSDSSGGARRLVRLLSGLSRVLDQAESRRPVSLVLVGEAPDGSTLADLERYGRILTIGTSGVSPGQVRQSVAVLMPLVLPSASSRGKAPLVEVADILGASLSGEHQALIDAAQVGPEQVRESLRRYISGAVQEKWNDGGES